MKKYMFLLVSALFLLSLGMTGCSSDDEETQNYQRIIGEVQNLVGTVYYDTNHNLWYIMTENNDGTENIRYDIGGMIREENGKIIYLQVEIPWQEIEKINFTGKVSRWVVDHPNNTGNDIILISEMEILKREEK